MSSLAAQLAQNSSLNANLLVDRSRRKVSASYLFTGREADQHDLEAIHALGVNSLLYLASINPKVEKFEDELFSDRAKDTDRTLLPADRIKDLDKNIEDFLWLLSPYLLEPPAGKILEWLVRRFRVNEFNVEAVLALFLPYHESPHFAKMLSILQIKPNSAWSFLIPYKSAAQNLPRVSLVTEMLKNSDVARFVTFLLPSALKKGLSHRVLLAFNAATLHDFIKRSKSINEGTVAYLLPALLKPLQPESKSVSKESVLGSYILLASLSRNCQLSPDALKVVAQSISSCAHFVRGDQFVSSLVAVCEPQQELEIFSEATITHVLSIPDIADALASGSTYAGSEKVLAPLVKDLADRLEDGVSLSLLEGIIATTATPTAVIQVLTTYLLTIGINPEANNRILVISRRLLSLIQQRHPKVLSKSADGLCQDDESLKEAIEQLLVSLSTVGQVGKGMDNQETVDVILASANADEKVRTMAVKELIKSINGKELSTIHDLKTIRSIFIARIQDTDFAVLEALYDSPTAITPIFASAPKEYFEALSLATAPHAKSKRGVLRLHLTYLVSSFWASADADMQKTIFHQILFPFLLFSKSKQKTAELVWNLVNKYLIDSTTSKVVGDWLTGCASLVNSLDDLTSVDVMNQINFNVSAKIADNIIASDHFMEHVDSVVEKLHQSLPHTQLMSYLIALSLVKRLSGEQQIEVAHKILTAMGDIELSGIDDMSQEHLTLGSEGDISFGKHAVTKPTSKTALNWIQVAAITAISRIPRPDYVINWISESPSSSVERGSNYASLMKSIYRVANASATRLPVLSTSILQILFITLKDDALVFLAGIWSTRAKQNIDGSGAISLLHAAAFLEAHIQEEDGVDFQTILPNLLVALQSSDTRTCQGALECISRVRILANTKFTSVYRFDIIYGHNDRTLQYLDQSDFKRYLDALVDHRDHFTNDPTYLKIFQEEHLGRTKGDKKKDIDYKHRVLCYLLSHINAIQLENSQNVLLKSVATISNKSKVHILLPTMQAMVQRVDGVPAMGGFNSISEELTTCILSCFDSTAATYLNDTASTWDVFVKLIRTYLSAGSPISSQQALVHSIENGLFTSLNQHRKIGLCEVLLDVGSHDSSAQSLSRYLLSSILGDIPLIINLLGSLTPAGLTSSPRVSKRVKTSESPDDTLPRLSLLAEILGTKSLPGSLDLAANLLDTLNKVVQSLPPTQADVSYIEQLLMSAIESTASKINEVPNLSPSVIRLDILVEVIRVSTNPQTFHQALLLIANLARLAPESVLYNVMPVFTFMGSNIFHRDDSYSFKVVQQTIDGIVPVMVSSLKEVHSQALDLYRASKEFLRVFTDAANHIPRHRRNNFFTHLVSVLGSRDFSAPICMLLLEKSANRIIRQPVEEIHNSLSLPISVFQHNGYDSQIHTATEILNESRRIVAHILDSNSPQPIFLEGTADGDHSASSTTILRRRAQALVIFIGYAFKPKTSSSSPLQIEVSVSSVIGQLVTLATLPQGAAATNETKIEDIAEAARASMNKLLGSMSVTDFIHAVQTMLESGDEKVQEGALELLAKRLPDISPRMRPNISGPVTKILVSIKGLIAVHKEGKLIIHAFLALKSIATTICPGEEGVMTDLIPYVLTAMLDKSTAAAALGAIASICVKFGPRIIPFFRTIISQSISILRSAETALFEDAFAILHGLLLTIPTFWGSGEVTQVIFLFIDRSSASSKPSGSGLSTLAKSLAKRIPATVLLPTLLDMWQGFQSSGNLSKISAYFEVFSRALQNADRPIVLEHLRSSFKIFLEALDSVKADDEARIRVILAFKELTVKLNEAAFKPLFRRLYDWAFVEDTYDNTRKTTFCHLYIGLLDFFKGLMVPYMSFLLQPFSDIMTSYKTSTTNNLTLWSSVIQILTRTLNFDDGGFWRDDKLRQLSAPLTAQIGVCVKANFVDGKAQLQDCFAALIESVTDDILLKSINLNILMNTRSEDARVRIFALASCEALWRANGGKLLGFVAETATFIAECGEDENDMVVKESFRLKDAVESIAGKIDGL